jgi:hypothetical protein
VVAGADTLTDAVDGAAAKETCDAVVDITLDVPVEVEVPLEV